MALYPAATFREIPPGANDPRITPLGWILHKAATNSTSLFGYFNGPSGGIESHFYIRKDGHVEQYRDTNWEADANYHGNSFELNGRLFGYLSVETQGLADDAWTDQQLREIKKLLLWGRTVHNIPIVKCSSATAPGVGYHTMWGAPGPWTPVAKDCPGKYSIAQFNNNLVPWFSNPVNPEDDMDLTPQNLADIATAVWAQKVGTTNPQSVGTIMVRIDPGGTGITAAVRDAVWDKSTTSAIDNTAVKALDLLRYTQGDSKRAIDILVDEDAQTDRIETAVNTPLDPVTISGIAAAVVAAMPPGEPVTQEALETALRNVLGSLDGA